MFLFILTVGLVIGSLSRFVGFVCFLFWFWFSFVAFVVLFYFLCFLGVFGVFCLVKGFLDEGFSFFDFTIGQIDGVLQSFVVVGLESVVMLLVFPYGLFF